MESATDKMDQKAMADLGPAESKDHAIIREKRFDWPLCYAAEEFLLNQIAALTARNSAAAQLAERMRSETGTLLFDWVDHVVLPAHFEPALANAGFVPDPLGDTPHSNQSVFWHPDAMLPRVIIDRTSRRDEAPLSLAIHVDSVSD